MRGNCGAGQGRAGRSGAAPSAPGRAGPGTAPGSAGGQGQPAVPGVRALPPAGTGFLSPRYFPHTEAPALHGTARRVPWAGAAPGTVPLPGPAPCGCRSPGPPAASRRCRIGRGTGIGAPASPVASRLRQRYRSQPCGSCPAALGAELGLLPPAPGGAEPRHPLRAGPGPSSPSAAARPPGTEDRGSPQPWGGRCGGRAARGAAGASAGARRGSPGASRWHWRGGVSAGKRWGCGWLAAGERGFPWGRGCPHQHTSARGFAEGSKGRAGSGWFHELPPRWHSCGSDFT